MSWSQCLLREAATTPVAASQTKKVDRNTGKAVNYRYDSLGRLIHSYQSDGSSIVQRTEHIYDTSNRLSRQSWQLGDTTYGESYTYDPDDGALTYIQGSGGIPAIAFEYDALKRLSGRYNYYFRQDYTYRDISSGSRTTTQVASIAYSQRPGGTNFGTFTLGYSYDNLGNISKVTGTGNTAQNASYTYDQQGQLTKEVNTKGTYNYSYDTYGNIRSVSGAESHSYTYGDSEWLDLLTAYDGEPITYDAIGNPTSYYNGTRWSFTWQNGRQLTTATDGNTNISYTYDVAGIRDSKTVGSTVYNYLTQNGKVVRQTWDNHTLDITYDNQGNTYCCIYDGTLYLYVLNLQGDVIRLVSTTGATAANYVYDAWGNVISSSGSMADINPIRYRGYYYDTETGLYYLGSRYYDPQVKRFVNADSSSLITSNPTGLTDKNLFAYCDNNPVTRVDDGGEFWHVAGAAILGGIGGLISAAASGDSLSTGFVVGAVSSGASALFGFGNIGGCLVTGVMGAFSSAIANVYEQKANNPTKKIDWGGVVFAAVTGGVSASVDSLVGKYTQPATNGCIIAKAVVATVSSAFTTTASVTATGIYSLKKDRTSSKNRATSKSRTISKTKYRMVTV